MNPTIPTFILFLLVGVQTTLPPIPGYLGAGIDTTTGKLANSVIKNIYLGQNLSPSDCNSHYSQHLRHCYYNQNNNQAYAVPYLAEVVNTPIGISVLDVAVITEKANLEALHKEVYETEDDDLFSSSSTTVTIIDWYYRYYMQDMYLSITTQKSSLYTLQYYNLPYLFEVISHVNETILNPYFTKSVSLLPPVYDRNNASSVDAYFAFLRNWGTSVITKLDMGASATQFLWFLSCFYAAANYGEETIVSQSEGVFHSSYDLDVNAWASLNVELSLYSYYEAQFSGGDAYKFSPWERESWIATVDSNPVPLKYYTRSIYHFMAKFPEQQQSMKLALGDYLKAMSNVTDTILSKFTKQRSFTPSACINGEKSKKSLKDLVEKKIKVDWAPNPLQVCNKSVNFDLNCYQLLDKIIHQSFEYEKSQKESSGNAKYLPNSIRSTTGSGFFTPTGSCASSSIVDFTYDNNEVFFDRNTNFTYKLPDQMNIYTDPHYRSAVAPIIPIVNASVAAEVSFSFSCSWHTKLGIIASALTPFTPLLGIHGSIAAGFREQISAEGKVLLLTYSNVNAMDVTLYPYNTLTGNENSNFQRAVAKLPSSYNQTAYVDFVEKYGNLLISGGNYGGRLLFLFEVAGSLYESSSAWVDFQARLTFSIFKCLLGFPFAAGSLVIDCNPPDLQFLSEIKLSVVIQGGDVIQSLSQFSYSNWLQSVMSNPALLEIHPVPIDQLVTVQPQRSFLTQTLEQIYTNITASNPSFPESPSCFSVGSYVVFECSGSAEIWQNCISSLSSLSNCCTLKV